MATKQENPQKDSWWINELESLGVSPKVKNGLNPNNVQKTSGLAENLKQMFYQAYKEAYNSENNQSWCDYILQVSFSGTVRSYVLHQDIKTMNTKIFFMAVAIVAAFGIAAAAVVGPATLTTPVVAQNITGDNASTAGGNVTGGNVTGANITTAATVGSAPSEGSEGKIYE
jgi:phosphoglucomutase